MRSEDWGIELLVGNQATPDVTHNLAVRRMQILCAASVIEQRNDPPSTPTDGDCYIVGEVPTGAWSEWANKLVGAYSSTWYAVPDVDSDGVDIPIGTRHAGLRKWCQYTGGFLLWDGAEWISD